MSKAAVYENAKKVAESLAEFFSGLDNDCPIEEAMRELPNYWEIVIYVERGATVVGLQDPDGNAHGVTTEASDSYDDWIRAATKLAIALDAQREIRHA